MRLESILILLCWFLCCPVVYAQESVSVVYSGQVLDAKSKEPVSNAIVLLLSERGSSDGEPERIAFGSTAPDGRYSIRVSGKKRPNLLEVRLMSYKNQRISLGVTTEEQFIYLEPDSEELPEVIVLGTPIVSRGDTVTYRASAFITSNTYSAEDLMKRLPGVSVDSRGIISYMGDPISGVYIEGLDLVANNYQTATRIIKAEDISAIDVMERFQKKKVLRGVEEGDGTMLNIRLKNNTMLTPSGEVMVGGGVLEEQGLVHSLGANTLLVNKRTQILGAGIWDTSTAQDSESIGIKKSVSSTSARAFGGNALTSYSDKSQALSQVDILGTLNQILVLREDVTVKYNIGYGCKSTSGRRGKESFLADKADYLHFTEERTNRIEGHLARAQLNYTENSAQRYLMNTLTVEGDWEQGTHNLFREEEILEEARANEYRLENNFSLASRQGDNTTTLEGRVSYRKLPGLIFEVPRGRYAYRQHIYGSDLSAYTRASYGWGLGGLYSIWGTVELDGRLEDIGLVSGIKAEGMSVDGGRLQVSSAPTLSYNASHLKWSISVPLQFNYLSYRFLDIAHTPQSIRRGVLTPGVSAKVSYRPSSFWYLSWNGRYTRNNLSEITDYLLGSYHTSFDQVNTRTEVIEPERNTLSAALNIEYRQAIRAIFGRLRLSAIRTIDNKIVSRTLEGTAKLSTQVAGKQTRDFIGGEVYLSKQFAALKSVVSISTDYAYTSYPMIIGGKHNKLSSQSMGGRLELISSPLSWMELSMSVSRREDRNRSSFGAFDLGEWKVKGGVTCSFFERWSAGVSGDYTAVSEASSNRNQSFALLMGTITYRHKRFRVEIKGDNLLNTKAIYQSLVTDADRYSNYFVLRPRQIMLSGYLKF